MSAVEEIEAAIAKLTELRDRCSPFRWTAEPGGDGWASIRNYNDRGNLITEIAEPLEDDALLIVTLHRTIDAQLAILRSTRELFDTWPKGELDPLVGDLVRAINSTPA